MPFDSQISKKNLQVLIVEDHRALAENISEFLGESFYHLDFAYDGLTALHLLSVNRYDVIVLDIMLPGLSGLELCKRIRNDLECNTPILFMTAHDDIKEKTSGFSLGGDDYLVKPFDMREMELRIQALSRRYTANTNIKSAGSIRFNADTLEVSLSGEAKVELSDSNARLFEVLIQHYPRFATHSVLSQAVWGIGDIDTHTLRTHIYNLRKSLNDALGYGLIKTMRGRGYRLIPPEEQ